MRKLFVSAFALMFISSVLAEQAREKVESEKNEPVVSDTISETKETPAEEVKAKAEGNTEVRESHTDENKPGAEPEKTGDSKSEVVSIDNLKADDLIKNAKLVFSCLNPECLAEQPVQTENGWILLLKPTEEVILILSNKDGAGLAKMLVKSGDCDPAVSRALSFRIEAMGKGITDEDVKTLGRLGISEHGTFEGFLTETKLKDRYASKMGEAKEPKRTFAAIPLEFSNEEVSLSFKRVKPLLQKKMDLAEEVVSAKESIEPAVAERNEKISPEIQKGLDELFALESENKILSDQVKSEKSRVAPDISAAEAEVKNSAADKAKAEADKKTAEASLTTAQSELPSAKSNLAAKQGRLGRLNDKKASKKELAAMKAETKNKKLNVNTAKAQVQNEINTLNTTVAAAEGRVNAANDAIADAASRIVAAEGRGAAATVKINSLRAGYEATEARIIANNARITQSNSSPDIIKAKVYAEDCDKKIDVIVDRAKELFDRLLES